MAPYSQTDGLLDSRRVLEGQLRQCYGRVVYSHKTHEKCADILFARLAKIKWWQIVLSALTTGGFIAAVFGAGKIGAAIGVGVSTVLLVLNAYTKDYDLGALAQEHRETAGSLWLIREKYLSLLTDLAMGERSAGELQAERDRLMEELRAVYSSAPSTTSQAYRRAQQALKMAEDMTFSDQEIDAFLPEELKRG